jgi:hypothetical protein
VGVVGPGAVGEDGDCEEEEMSGSRDETELVKALDLLGIPARRTWVW